MPRWSPWQAASKMPNVEIRLDRLPNQTGGGVLARYRDRAIIIIDRRLVTAERTVILAHELIHLERGSTSRCVDDGNVSPHVIHEERAVQREVASRLVPAAELGAFVDRLVSIEHPVTARDVAEEFSVTQVVASQALHDLATVRARRMSA